MASYASHLPVVTPLTLALFEDSGWYQANYEFADWLRPAGDWGFQQGCTFAFGKCITPIDASVGMGTPPHFYGQTRTSQTYNRVCTPDHRAIGFVTLASTSSVPLQYQYFSDPSVVGGAPSVFDYCPAIQAYSDANCWDPASASVNSPYFGETYGPTSACLTSTLLDTSVYVSWALPDCPPCAYQAFHHGFECAGLEPLLGQHAML